MSTIPAASDTPKPATTKQSKHKPARRSRKTPPKDQPIIYISKLI
ncbi:MAG: hypothetical protein V9G19_13175 [Tetrasphaera sp.]